MLTANIDVATTPLTPKLMPLPKLKMIVASPPRMSVNLPVRVSYASLTTAISQAVKGKTFQQRTPAGNISVKVQSAEVYPSNGRLVVGLEVSAKLPISFLDTQGAVYLLATPKIENGTKIVLSDTGFSQTLDNKFWSVAAIVFEGQI